MQFSSFVRSAVSFAPNVAVYSGQPNGAPRTQIPRSSKGLSDRHASGASAARSSGHGMALVPHMASFPMLTSIRHACKSSAEM
eukprot:4402036-Pyramimonas_sp.AAC.1